MLKGAPILKYALWTRRCTFTFALEALLSQDADKGEELGDLFEVQHSGVVELDDGHGFFVVGAAAAVLPQTGETKTQRRHWKRRNNLRLVSEIITTRPAEAGRTPESEV